LRITDWYSMIYGTPVPSLRVIEADGVVRGEVAFVWTERADWPRRSRATRCGPYEDSTRTCTYVVPPSASSDWRVVAARLDSLGAWRINERCENDRFITDTGELIVERLDGMSSTSIAATRRACGVKPEQVAKRRPCMRTSIASPARLRAMRPFAEVALLAIVVASVNTGGR
jgi:hypothetical protein